MPLLSMLRCHADATMIRLPLRFHYASHYPFRHIGMIRRYAITPDIIFAAAITPLFSPLLLPFDITPLPY
jgi:hypothetical protein